MPACASPILPRKTDRANIRRGSRSQEGRENERARRNPGSADFFEETQSNQLLPIPGDDEPAQERRAGDHERRKPLRQRREGEKRVSRIGPGAAPALVVP